MGVWDAIFGALDGRLVTAGGSWVVCSIDVRVWDRRCAGYRRRGELAAVLPDGRASAPSTGGPGGAMAVVVAELQWILVLAGGGEQRPTSATGHPSAARLTLSGSPGSADHLQYPQA